MQNKRKRPRGFTDQQEDKACITCKVYGTCGLLKEANRLSRVSGEKEPLDDNFFCSFWEDEENTDNRD